MMTVFLWVFFGCLLVAECFPLVYLLLFKRHNRAEDLVWTALGILLVTGLIAGTAAVGWVTIEQAQGEQHVNTCRY